MTNAEQTTSGALYARLRRVRPDWPTIEAARVAVAYPGISPRDDLGRSVAFPNPDDEAKAQALASEV
jgi:hypothetical protein